MELTPKKKFDYSLIILIVAVIFTDFVFNLSIFELIILWVGATIINCVGSKIDNLIAGILAIIICLVVYLSHGVKGHIYAVYGETGVQFCTQKQKDFNPNCIGKDSNGGAKVGAIRKIEYMGRGFYDKNTQ